MSTMIERVARAMCEAADDNWDWSVFYIVDANDTAETGRGVYRDMARAAIAEMMEPTDAMKLAGGFKCEAIMFEDDPDGTGVVFNDMGHVYKAMVKVALQEGP